MPVSKKRKKKRATNFRRGVLYRCPGCRKKMARVNTQEELQKLVDSGVRPIVKVCNSCRGQA